MSKFKYDACKLCFYRGNDRCYEIGYFDTTDENKITSVNVDEYFLRGCKKLRLDKIKKLKNVNKE